MGKHAYGHGTYFKMMEIALKFDIPVDMVAATILRSVLSEWYGFKCECPEEKLDMRRDGRRPHCKWCWSFIEVIQKREKFEDPMGRVHETRPLKYKRVRNKFEEELRRKLRHELEESPLSCLEPDQRGGE